MEGERRAVSYFGVEVSTGVWYWFERLNFFSDDLYRFTHRYSINSGKKTKGVLTGIRFERKIREYLNS